jgi:hypothetical protein
VTPVVVLLIVVDSSTLWLLWYVSIDSPVRYFSYFLL